MCDSRGHRAEGGVGDEGESHSGLAVNLNVINGLISAPGVGMPASCSLVGPVRSHWDLTVRQTQQCCRGPSGLFFSAPALTPCTRGKEGSLQLGA